MNKKCNNSNCKCAGKCKICKCSVVAVKAASENEKLNSAENIKDER